MTNARMSDVADPLSLLKALSPLLNQAGGVGGVEQMEKIVRFMQDAKFLVNRCVYLNILRITEGNDILEKFLNDGGWLLMNKWLVEAKNSKNLALVLDVMQVLQRLPLRIDHLKQNNTPKLVKLLVKSSSCSKVKSTASSLMSSWLTIIRDASGTASSNNGDSSTKKKKLKSKTSADKIPKKETKKAPPVVKAPSFAKFRKTGLETEQQPPKKALKGERVGMKRSSVEDHMSLLDKKAKIEPKQPKKLTISDGFMDALNSVPTVVKRPIKRKALGNKSKVTGGTTQSQKFSPSHEVSVSGEAGDFGEEATTPEKSPSPEPSEPTKPKLNKYGKPMKKVRWAEDAILESIRYFKLEDGERVNVTTQNFKDALHRERLLERESMGGFQHKGDGDWKKPYLIDLSAPLAVIGCNSVEKDIQAEREKMILQVIFLSISMVPDSPTEPDPEPYDMIPPQIIPIDDPNDPGPVVVSHSPPPADDNVVLKNMINTVPEKREKTSDEHIKDKLREILQQATGASAVPDATISPMDVEEHHSNGMPFPENQQMVPSGADPNMVYSVPPPGAMMNGVNGFYHDPKMMMGPPSNMRPQMNSGQYGPKWRGPPPGLMPHPNMNMIPPNVPPLNMRHSMPPRQGPMRGRMSEGWRPREPWRARGPRPRMNGFRGRWSNNRGQFRR